MLIYYGVFITPFLYYIRNKSSPTSFQFWWHTLPLICLFNYKRFTIMLMCDIYRYIMFFMALCLQIKLINSDMSHNKKINIFILLCDLYIKVVFCRCIFIIMTFFFENNEKTLVWWHIVSVII